MTKRQTGTRKKKATKGGRGGARPGSGPKPKPAHLLRRNAFMLKLLDGELAEIKRAAKAAGKPPSTLVREVVLRALSRRRSR